MSQVGIEKEQCGTDGESSPVERCDWEEECLAEMLPKLGRLLKRRVNDSHAIDDLVQDTVVRALRFRRGLRSRAAFEGWLLRIAYNVGMDWHRRLRRQSDRNGSCAEYDEVHSPMIDEPADHRRLVSDESSAWRSAVERALRRLAPRDCVLVLAHYFVGLSCREIAQRSGLSVANVKVRLYRARATLRRALPSSGEYRQLLWAQSRYDRADGVLKAARSARVG